MLWAQSADAALFRFINQQLATPWLDWCMPFFSGNRFFVPAVLVVSILLIARGGPRARLFVPVLFVILALGDGFVINNIKHAAARPRPYLTQPDTRELVGRGNSGSMPSSHTSTWFAATFLSYLFYRKSWRFMLPLALLVAFSRIYVGAHYPSDVLAGALLGAGYAAAGLVAIEFLWRRLGPKWFPLQAARWPSVLSEPPPTALQEPASTPNYRPPWLALGYVLIAITLLARLLYISAGKIELSEDEAYQWLWSKHLALSYFSKPPLIAYTQFLGTSLFGDTELGVRFFASVIAAIISLAMLRFMARVANPRAAFWLVVIMQCAPLLAVGATLMTIDPLLVLFWTAGMIAGWRAVQPAASVRDWVWVGLAIGAGFLSKYSALYQLLCFALFLWFCRPEGWRKPGPYLAGLLALFCTLPVLLWNSEHGWITLRHVSENAGLNKAWRAPWKYVGDFIVSETFLLNPVFLLAAIVAGAAAWKQRRQSTVASYFFWMSAPVLVGHLLYTFHSRVFPNWIAPAVVPMLALAVVYWEERARDPSQWPRIKRWLIAGITVGAVPIILLHDTNLIGKLTGYTLPAKLDPLRRVRAWRATAAEVGAARENLLGEGKDVFIIAAHYGLAGEISFYLPEAKASVKKTPLVYYQSSERPENQFYFWPGYENRVGQNAIYVREEKETEPVSPRLQQEFESVSELGVRRIEYRGRIFRTLRLYACRNLRADAKQSH